MSPARPPRGKGKRGTGKRGTGKRGTGKGGTGKRGTGARSKKGAGSRKGGGSRRRRLIARLQTFLLVIALLAAGALLGSFWLEWRHVRLDAGPPPAEVAGMPASLPVVGAPGRVQVEVLNGAGDEGAAMTVTEELRAMGFDVVTFGNADNFEYERTLVVDRSRRDGAARRVADSLGIEEIGADPLNYPYLDVTVILGDDWSALLDDRARTDARTASGWLDRLLPL